MMAWSQTPTTRDAQAVLQQEAGLLVVNQTASSCLHLPPCSLLSLSLLAAPSLPLVRYLLFLLDVLFFPHQPLTHSFPCWRSISSHPPPLVSVIAASLSHTHIPLLVCCSNSCCHSPLAFRLVSPMTFCFTLVASASSLLPPPSCHLTLIPSQGAHTCSPSFSLSLSFSHSLPDFLVPSPNTLTSGRQEEAKLQGKQMKLPLD